MTPRPGVVLPGGGLAATPMARLRERTRDVLVDAGVSEARRRSGRSMRPGTRRTRSAWRGRWPTSARCSGGSARAGRRVAVATSDDRDPTERTLAALGLTDAIDALVCADDGVPVKPAPDMVLRLCAELGVRPGRTAVVGDSPADLRMGRAAGAGPGRRRADRRRCPLRPRAAGRRRDRVGRGISEPELAATADQAEHEQEQVDEVEVELERADDGRLLHRAGRAARSPDWMRWTS